MLMRCLFIAILCLVFFPTSKLSAKDVTIVTSGSTEPDTVYLSRNAAALQQVPLDGVCTWIATPTPIKLEKGGTDICRLPSGRLNRHVTGEDGFDVGQSVVFRWRIPEANIMPAIADLQAAEFLAPSIVGLFGHPDRTHGLARRLATGKANLHLPQLRNDFFRFGSLAHSSGP